MSLDTVSDDGGSTITTYNLEWDKGLGTSVFEELKGETSDDLDQTFTKSSLTTGTSYQFRYRVGNVFGLTTTYSPIATIVCGTKPDAPSAPTTTTIIDVLKISWAAPAANGPSISAY